MGFLLPLLQGHQQGEQRVEEKRIAHHFPYGVYSRKVPRRDLDDEHAIGGGSEDDPLHFGAPVTPGVLEEKRHS